MALKDGVLWQRFTQSDKHHLFSLNVDKLRVIFFDCRTLNVNEGNKKQ